MKANTKDWIQYASAVAMIGSGIVLAFLSFWTTEEHTITEGVLWYIAQALTFAGGIFGISLYVKTKVGEVKSEIIDEARRWMRAQPDSTRQHMSERVTDEQIAEARRHTTEYWNSKDENNEEN